ncbi:MAG TPA: hypothetical protein VJ805_04390 [Nitrospiraceae bacterium]|nr:hypothetical protein [Nitrospiraceae bacterium]
MIVSRFRKFVLLAVVAPSLLLGCALPREPTRTSRTAIEQLLLSQAITRSVKHLSIPIASGQPVVVEVAGFPQDRSILQAPFSTPQITTTTRPADQPVIRHEASDLPVVQGKIEGRLGELGLPLRTRREDARYLFRVVVEALGTEQGETFFGMPPVQSVLIPFALPQITLYEEQRQRAYARFTIDVYDARTGELIRSTAWYEGSAYYNQYTVFFFFSFKGSDLVATP